MIALKKKARNFWPPASQKGGDFRSLTQSVTDRIRPAMKVMLSRLPSPEGGKHKVHKSELKWVV
jgi:hypothetical protein